MFTRTSSAFALWVLAFICLASWLLMSWASHTDSPIDDELAHIPAGYGYVHNLDYRLNPEHPPLVKALAMFPVLFLNPVFPTQSDAWQKQVNAQWDMGRLFLYGSGNNADAIAQTARIFPMIIMLFVIIFIYIFSRGLMGNWWALLPATLFALSPTALAHGHYVTTDMGAAFGILFATYYFLKYVDTPTKKHLWYAGLSFGVAQLMKFSTPFLVPLFIFLAFVLWLRNVIIEWPVMERSRRLKIFFRRGAEWLSRLIIIFAIGYVFVVYPVYAVFTTNYPIQKQVADTQTILQSFANGPAPAGQFCHGLRCLAELDIAMAKIPLFRPFAEYLLGILMVLQRADGGNTIYFLGHVVGAGGWTYFPLLFVLKEPIPTLAIVFVALAIAMWQVIRRDSRNGRGRFQRIIDYIAVNFAEFSMVSFIILYWGYSMRSPLNIGFRHLIPTIPFIYILATGIWKKWVASLKFPMGPITPASIGITMRSFFGATLKYLLLVSLVVWLFMETVLAAPYFLSYFNEFAGGTMHGYRYVTDSNYDWGQDLLRLQSWAARHPEVDKIAVDYFGGGNPKYTLGSKEVDWASAKGNPADQGIHWFAISINQLEGATQPLVPGQNRKVEDSYSWLTTLRPPAAGMGEVPPPDYRAGTSLFIYHL